MKCFCLVLSSPWRLEISFNQLFKKCFSFSNLVLSCWERCSFIFKCHRSEFCDCHWRDKWEWTTTCKKSHFMMSCTLSFISFLIIVTVRRWKVESSTWWLLHEKYYCKVHSSRDMMISHDLCATLAHLPKKNSKMAINKNWIVPLIA